MTAWLVSGVPVRDADALQACRTRATAWIIQHRGRYLARGGEVERIEGTWEPGSSIIVEFSSIEQARTARRDPGWDKGFTHDRPRVAAVSSAVAQPGAHLGHIGRVDIEPGGNLNQGQVRAGQHPVPQSRAGLFRTCWPGGYG